MKVVRQGDSDAFTYVSGHTRTCSLYCYLRMAFDLQLELPKWMRSMAQSVPVMVVKEPVSVADRQKKIVNTKTNVNTKRQKKTFEKNKAIFFERGTRAEQHARNADANNVRNPRVLLLLLVVVVVE